MEEILSNHKVNEYWNCNIELDLIRECSSEILIFFVIIEKEDEVFMKQYTPMMQQYLEVKENYQDALVFYRLGDFYEMFFEDAKIASSELDLVLTGRSAGVEERVPMCGVPHHAANNYIQRLIQKGYKVAVVEQLEDPSVAKGIVKRDVVRVITPGTAMDDLGEDKSSIYIASVIDYQYGLALAICDMSTGETSVKNIQNNSLVLNQQLLKHNIKEIVVQESFSEKKVQSIRDLGMITISYCDELIVPEEYLPLCSNVKEDYFIKAYGLLLNYLLATQKRMLHHLRTIEVDSDDQYVYMDYSTQQNLELVTPLRQGTKNETLWSFLDYCKTAMGSRMLRKWVEKPLVKKEEILKRQSAITYLLEDSIRQDDLKEHLANIYDLERLIARIAYGTANAIDCIRLQKSLKETPEIMTLIQGMNSYPEFTSLDLCQDLADILENAFVENPPVSIKEGGMFQDGYSQELDECRKIQREGKAWILQLESKEREKTGIKTLKVGYNRVFGYYFEVSKANRDLIKEEHGYVRKQTLTNAERFVTSELKEREDAILHAEERSIRLETEIFMTLLERIQSYSVKLQKLSNALATIDALYALSVVSDKNGYTKPVFNQDGVVSILEGRHPILETLLKDTRYVSNSMIMDQSQQIWIITGPNMGGKSTFMRQCALIVLLAQIGCYVPAKECNLPIFDKIFTRIGASDDILSGQSTFMVEMNEANQALQNATKNSLILFDEIGRGTSTYDGMALAQAMIEYIATCIQAKTLFSTHYHELTTLEESLTNVKNYHVEVHEENDHVTFLYRVKMGKADKSYGINVAKLAKLPESVIDRAKGIQKELESTKRVVQQSLQVVEMVKTSPEVEVIKNYLDEVDENQLTPLEALQLVHDLKKELKK